MLPEPPLKLVFRLHDNYRNLEAALSQSVGYQFRTLTGMPGVPKVVNLVRTARVAKAPLVPGS